MKAPRIHQVMQIIAREEQMSRSFPHQDCQQNAQVKGHGQKHHQQRGPPNEHKIRRQEQAGPEGDRVPEFGKAFFGMLPLEGFVVVDGGAAST